MSTNMYDALDNDNGTKDAEARRAASLGALKSEQSEQFLADVARAKAEGMILSPRMTMAAGYAEGYRAAAKEQS